MSGPPVDRPEYRFAFSSGIFPAARLDHHLFYAKTFILAKLHQQQDRITSQPPPLDSSSAQIPRPHPPPPRSISSLVSDPDELVRQRLGRNILDSFALLFCQPGADGVVATAMSQLSDQPRTFGLVVSRNVAQHETSADLAARLHSWFQQDTFDDALLVRGVDVNPSCAMWDHILAIRRSDIYLRIRDDCKAYSSDIDRLLATSISCFERQREEMSSSAINTTKNGNEITQKLVSILEALRSTSKHWQSQTRSMTLDPTALQQLDDALRRITWSCFMLVESHPNDLNRVLAGLNRGGSNSGQRPPPGWKTKFKRIIYTLATYQRAWLDLCRFRRDQGPIRLEISFSAAPINSPSGSWVSLDRLIQEGERAIANWTPDWTNKLRKKSTTTAGEQQPRRRRDESLVSAQTSSLLLPDLPNTNENNPPSQTIRWAQTRVHCEMQIMESVLSNNNNDNNNNSSSSSPSPSSSPPSSSSGFFFYDYIGCSKGPCWLCHHALAAMAPGFAMRESHLKIYGPWAPPTFLRTTEGWRRFTHVLRWLDDELSLRVARIGLGGAAAAAPSGGLSSVVVAAARPDCPDLFDFVSPRVVVGMG
ncbi:hypothetical protein F4778DRAFT_582766 [Xylariomycetidae sp. FL2044]|nr:hypothetical protein F4778DRAFT_582766 [Xylariomycetidae sp. FL2044]